MADPLNHSRRIGSFWLDMMVALAAVCISIASLWVALRADHTQERLLAASVWPILQYETSDYAQTGASELPQHVIQFTVTNAGVGPARVRWFDAYYRGKSIPNGYAMLHECCQAVLGDSLAHALISNYMQTRVIGARESVHFIEVLRNANNIVKFGALDRERLKVYVRACYCSALGDCWLFDSRISEPTPLQGCPAADKPAFQG